MNNELLQILKSDVKPALGCTGPVSVIYAASEASKAVGGEVRSIDIVIDRDTYKNSIAVVTPGTDYRGIVKPAILGALYGNPDFGLEALREMTEYDASLVEKLQCTTSVKLRQNCLTMGIYIDIVVYTDLGRGRAIVAQTHDGLVLKEANGKILMKDPNYHPEDTGFEAQKPIRKYGVRDLYDFSVSVPLEELLFLKDAARDNTILAEAGLENGCGSGFGQGLLRIGGMSACNRAKALAAAASDARMSGVALPAMSCGGSGNVGITGAVPLVVMAEEMGKGEESLLRSIALSYLLIILVKSHIGRLSPLCACSLAASIGVAAGMCLLMDGEYQHVENAIHTLVGSIGGVLCDGAKFGCAMKLATGVGTALECAQLSMQGVHIAKRDGLVCDTADETIALVGRLASRAMLPADDYMSREIIRREGVIDSDEICDFV